jgi:thiamine-phosphate pyrophosphorylase
VTALPKLIAISDVSRRGLREVSSAFEVVCAGSAAGTVALLLREPMLEARAQLRAGQLFAETARRHGQQLWVRDRVDLALILGAQGLHLSEQAIGASAFAKLLSERGTECRLSRAWHDLEQEPDPGADVLVVSPVGEARKGNPSLGRAGLARALARSDGRPVYALGGMTAENSAWALANGAQGVAAIGAIYEEPAALLGALGISQA